ncbi:MAG: phage major capsid protein [Prevotellaceae bacterium]|jgi:hypothetical protein|nr:phage major capsid protein [Prevotellaceae bacterium]
MSVSIQTAYNGEVLENLLVRATTNNELVSGGHIHLQPDVSKKFSIPRLRAGSMLQKRIEDPQKEDSQGNFTIDEVYLEPKDVMAYTVFNPRSFEQFWRKWQPTGNLLFHELPTDAQNAMLAELAKVVDFELGTAFLTGVYGPSAGQFFDGILTKIVANPDVVSLAGADAITEANVISVLGSVKGNISKSLRGNPNLKIFMSVEDADIYDSALTNRQFKGTDYTDRNPERFKGIQIVPLAAMPKDAVFAAVGSSGLDSNLWAGVSLADDCETVQIDKLSNPSELYFFKMLMKIDTNIVWGEDVVLYDGRA